MVTCFEWAFTAKFPQLGRCILDQFRKSIPKTSKYLLIQSTEMVDDTPISRVSFFLSKLSL